MTAAAVENWLQGPFDEATKREIEKLQRENPDLLQDAFYTTLSFGTAGMRGLMGVGTNRMNEYTIRGATQGLANYMKRFYGDKKPLHIAVGYDFRHHSKEFAITVARVMAANGIGTYIFKHLRPTPLVSFLCRYKKCDAGVMITASHNPPDYNGYKVYWNDGGQVLPPHDKGIMEEVAKVKDLARVSLSDPESPLIQWVEEIDEAYLKAIYPLQLYPKEKSQAATLKILYSSLHGTGITMVPRALDSYGFSSVGFVDAQIIVDGNFPTAHSPNPEEKKRRWRSEQKSS